MRKILRNLLGFIFIWFIIFFSADDAQAEVGAPKILKLNAGEEIFASGAAPAPSEILVYLDNSYIGQVDTQAQDMDCLGPMVDCPSAWQFKYRPTKELARGRHVLMVAAKDKTSLVLSAPSQEIKFTINEAPAPTVLEPNKQSVTSDLRPLLIGLTKDGTSVKFFIDGVFRAQTGFLKDNSGTANFAIRPEVNLGRGFHKVSARAEDEKGGLSEESEALTFNIEFPLPAPTIFAPVVNSETSIGRPFIVGLAKNNSRVKIYIDKEYHGELKVKNHESGTANFAFKPKLALKRGLHAVYTIAVNSRGKVSSRSNNISFHVKRAAIAEAVQEKKIKQPGSKKIKNENEPIQSNIISPQTGKITPGSRPPEKARPPEIKGGKDELKKIKDLIDNNENKIKSDQGIVNESKLNQVKLKMGEMIFILFLIAVVAWLLWVNRELIKEKRAPEPEDQSQKDQFK